MEMNLMKVDLVKKKKRKGFTLIELIVVIAIRILAAIAVPRFSGFTDKGKIAADTQYAALIKNAAITLLADESLTSIGTITISPTGILTSTMGGFTTAKFTALVPTTTLKYYKGSTGGGIIITFTNLDGTNSIAYNPGT